MLSLQAHGLEGHEPSCQAALAAGEYTGQDDEALAHAGLQTALWRQ